MMMDFAQRVKLKNIDNYNIIRTDDFEKYADERKLSCERALYEILAVIDEKKEAKDPDKKDYKLQGVLVTDWLNYKIKGAMGIINDNYRIEGIIVIPEHLFTKNGKEYDFCYTWITYEMGKAEKDLRIKLKRLKKLVNRPSEWEGETVEGKYIHVWYTTGVLVVESSDCENDWWKDVFKVIYEKKVGSFKDDKMATDKMLIHTGLEAKEVIDDVSTR
jgi:hypothetical protein